MLSNNAVVLMSIYRNDDLENVEVAIGSILSQTYCYFSFYIGIDGDVNADVLDYLEGIKDYRISIFKYKEQRGLACVLNDLIDEALKESFEFFFRMDADDISLVERFYTQLKYLDENENVDILGSGCIEFNKDGLMGTKLLPNKHEDLVQRFVVMCPFIHPSVVIRRKVFELGLRYRELSIRSEDYYLWLDSIVEGFTLANVSQPLIKYRISNDTGFKRSGIKKSIDEAAVRIYAMKKLKLYSMKNLLYIVIYFLLRCLPSYIVSMVYKKLRPVFVYEKKI